MKRFNFSFKQLLALGVAACMVFTFASCEDDDTDPTGSCDGVTCPAGEVCVDGTCLAECGSSNCAVGEICISGICIDESTHVLKSGSITSDETWSSNRIYVLQNRVVVDNGATLTIQPGTIIKGAPGNGANASALLIARGSQINAAGTASSPIIFTSLTDNIQIGETRGTNLTATSRQEWGGLIILGAAPISAGDGDDQALIEGIPPDETFGLYGGTNVADNSGTLTYVSVRHGGSDIGEGNEINGITFGGVGNGTTVDNIEVFATLDDGVEFFGGSVNATNVLVANQGDDAVDIDQSYSGTVDNFLVVMGGGDGDKGLEIDGPESTVNPDGLFTLRNGTILGTESRHVAADLKSRAQGTITNCSFQGFEDANHLLMRFSASNAGGCAESGDAHRNFVDNRLLVGNNEAVSSSSTVTAANFLEVYYDDDDPSECASLVNAAVQSAVDQSVINQGNMLSMTPTRGADTDVFAWTISNALNLY